MNDDKSISLATVNRRHVVQGMAAAMSLPLLGVACGREEDEPAAVQTPESIPPGNAALDAESLAGARQLLRDIISIDVHCHPGMFFFDGMVPEDPVIAQMASAGGFAHRTISDMASGGMSVALFATVADIALIGMSEKGGLYARREFEPGEAYADHRRQLGVLQRMVDEDRVVAVRSVDDFAAAKDAGRVGAMFAAEGGDFLERKGERVEEAYDAGLRAIGLVHYHVNDIGDIQTAEPVHGGLTGFGREVVKEMNRLGMVIDMAHATFETAQSAAETSSHPLIVSHSFVEDAQTRHPRLLSEDHARMIAATGGLIGAWPAGIATPDFGTFVDRMLRLIDVVGIDHVGLGTDMDANFRPVFTNYQQLPHLPVILAQRGLGRDEIGKLLGGNFIRVFAEITGA